MADKRYHLIDNGDTLLCWDYKDEQMYRLDKETKDADKIRPTLMQMLKFNPYVKSLGQDNRAPAWVTKIVNDPDPRIPLDPEPLPDLQPVATGLKPCIMETRFCNTLQLQKYTSSKRKPEALSENRRDEIINCVRPQAAHSSASSSACFKNASIPVYKTDTS